MGVREIQGVSGGGVEIREGTKGALLGIIKTHILDMLVILLVTLLITISSKEFRSIPCYTLLQTYPQLLSIITKIKCRGLDRESALC